MPINKEHYEKLNSERDTFSIEDLVDKSDRTLLYGYTLDRQDVHVYVKNEEVHYIEYDIDNNILFEKSGVFEDISELIPSKRSYPESTDPEFLAILMRRGVSGNFTTYCENRYEKIKNKKYQGFVL